MSPPDVRSWSTPRERDLGLHSIGNNVGLGVSVLPNGSVFTIEHRSDSGTILVNQVLASPVDGGIGRILLRAAGTSPTNIEAVGSRANRLGVAVDRVAREGVTSGIRHRVSRKKSTAPSKVRLRAIGLGRLLAESSNSSAAATGPIAADPHHRTSSAT